MNLLIRKTQNVIRLRFRIFENSDIGARSRKGPALLLCKAIVATFRFAAAHFEIHLLFKTGPAMACRPWA
jgi:hypothetical protein